MNNKKYVIYLSVVSILCTYHNSMTNEEKAQQLSSKTTQEIKDTQEKSDKSTKTSSPKKSFLKKILDAPSCPHQSIPVRKMTLQELLDIYEYGKNHKIDLHLKSNVLERLIALSDNHAGVKTYKLEFADTHFAMNHLEIAAIYYEDFANLYPSSKEAQYAAFKSLGCMFRLSLDADRDQTNTKKTVALAKEFLKQHPDHELAQEVQEILTTCYQRLLDHEIYVFNFYVHRKKFKPARMRLDFIATTFQGLINNLETKVKELTQQLELAINPPIKKKSNPSMHKFLG